MSNRVCVPQICWSMLLLLFMLAATSVFAQSTAFTYQGKLTDSGNPASGSYDFQFKLFDTATVGTGTQFGSMVPASSVTVSNGIFNVALDFGAAVFPGANRFLEMAVRPGGVGAFTLLSPRQQVNANPYSIKSLNAATADGLSVACLNCVTSGQIQSVNGSQVSGAIPVASVPPSSGHYIQNSTSQQAGSNLNISGNGIFGGNVGIGTTAPAKHLHVRGTGDQEIMIESADAGGIKWSLQSSTGASNGRFEVIDRTANVNRFTILGSGNVGIGTNTPAAKLDVAGDIAFAPQTSYISIPPVAFNPEEDGYPFFRYERFVQPKPMVGDVQLWYAPVYLPDGVVVTELRALIDDTDNVTNIDIELWRFAQDDFSAGQLARVTSNTTSSSNPSKKFYTDATITASLSVINNSTYHYQIRFFSDTDKITIGAVRITYTYTHP